MGINRAVDQQEYINAAVKDWKGQLAEAVVVSFVQINLFYMIYFLSGTIPSSLSYKISWRHSRIYIERLEDPLISE